jgi:hypothetical protein
VISFEGIEETHAVRSAAEFDEALGLVLVADHDGIGLAGRVQALSFVGGERSDYPLGMAKPPSW